MTADDAFLDIAQCPQSLKPFTQALSGKKQFEPSRTIWVDVLQHKLMRHPEHQIISQYLFAG